MCFFFFFKQKTAYEMRISDWSSDVCSSDLYRADRAAQHLGAIGTDVQAQTDHGHGEGTHFDIERWHRQHEVQPEQLHQQRRAAEDLDVGDGERKSVV